MIRRIKGELLEKTVKYCTVMTGSGIGFQIYIPENYYQKMPESGNQVELYTYMAVREDSMDLYGFTESEQLAVFELVMNVSGIGPKIALAVVGNISPTQFYLSVLNDQVGQLTKVPGIGKKSAQRIILELKEKVKELTDNQTLSEDPIQFEGSLDEAKHVKDQGEQVVSELKDALISLGYTKREIDKTVENLKGSISFDQDMQDLLRIALQELNKR